MKKLILALALSASFQAHAGVTTFTLNDIGTFAGYTSNDTSQTFAGSGFVGMYNTQWAHLFGIEISSYSRTLAQVNIGSLAGKQINSAMLSFSLLDGDTNSQLATVTGFNGGSGNLAFNFNAPGTNYGSVNATVSGGANALDITDLLTASVAANDGWLGLHFQGSDLYQWTYTKDGFGSNRANLQLTVDFADTTDVPEPASLGMLAIGALALAAARRKTRHAA